MIRRSYACDFRRSRQKIESLTTEELDAINTRLRTAYHLVDEVDDIVKDRVSDKLRRRYLDARWELRMVGENLNDRIDWLGTPFKEICGEDGR